MWSTEVLVFTLTVVSIVLLRKWWRFTYLAHKIPRMSVISLLTSLWHLTTGNGENLYEIFSKIFERNELTRVLIGPLLMVSIALPEDVKIVLNSRECLDLPHSMSKLTTLTESLLFGNGAVWRSHRKILNPYFGLNSLRSIIPIFKRKVKVLMKNLAKLEGEGEFNVLNSLTALTLETFLSVMEYDIDIQNRKDERRDVFKTNLNIYIETIMLRLSKIWLHISIIFERSSVGKKFKNATENCAFIFAPEIMKTARENTDNNNNNEKPKTFIRALVNPRNNLPDSEILDEIKSLTVAAQDTSSIATAATLLLLGMHKNIQDKVIDEITQVLGTSVGYLDIERLNKLNYLEATINEAMRLIPVVPLLYRVNNHEITTSQGYIIPAKSILAIPIFKIHRAKENFGDDADKFRPERFNNDNIHPYAFIPFAKGPRMCIAWRYAMFLMKIQLVSILLKYKIDTSLKLEELRFTIGLTSNIRQGFRISLSERHLESDSN